MGLGHYYDLQNKRQTKISEEILDYSQDEYGIEVVGKVDVTPLYSQDEYGIEVMGKADVTPLKSNRKRNDEEEAMYSTNQVIQIAELMATLAYAEGFQEAANLKNSKSKKKSRLVAQVLSTREMTLEYVHKFVPPEIREGISLPLKYD